ncbi:hypothetical protein CPB84DRAFT_1674366 [Gymnopilus junonius]|uniref:Uncharacterized protein n=1 Tax=Gymnopilus junonius TaxID=109634 RepID=A0A9P5NT65_GYMJU|nr:hypothetical protein CPB84DRAFT_1674366 [Gymnopilus junonius]
MLGIAFMEYYLAEMALPIQDESLAPKSLTSLADEHLARVIRHRPGYAYSPTRLSFIESSIGIATLVLARGLWTSEESIINDWNAAKDYLETTIEQVLLEDSDVYSPRNKEDASEVLYGRAGLLYALLYLRKAIKGKPQQQITLLEGLTSDSNLARVVDSIVSRGKHGAFSLSSEFRPDDGPRLPPLMWTWHGKRYLGGGHGVAGILHILLKCPSTIIEKHLQDIFSTISWLIDCQDETGNWPSKCPTQRGVSAHNDLIQWCHGAPAMIILLSTALRIFQDYQQKLTATNSLERRIRRSIESGASLTYKNGLLRKGVGLCHGVAGSVYALVAASDALDTSSKKEFFTKAAHLAFLGTLHEDMTSSGEMSVPDHPLSLYEGLAGACCAWAEVLCRMNTNDSHRSHCGFPGFDDFATS